MIEKPLNPAAAAICPHLGMRDDPSAYFSYASLGNRCYHCGRPAIPIMAQQEAYCLKGAQKDCPVFTQADGRGFPAELKAAEAGNGARPKTAARWLALLVGLGLVALLGWWFIPGYLPLRGAEASQQAAPVVIARPSETTVPPTNSPVPTLTTAPTDTAVPQVHALEAAINVGERELRMHRVEWGDTFESLAATYVTTPDVIRALNHNLVPPLRSNSVIVVAPGLQAPDPMLPAFRTYEVTAAESTIEALAQELGVDPGMLGHYNGCDQGCQLAAGDWLLIPVSP